MWKVQDVFKGREGEQAPTRATQRPFPSSNCRPVCTLTSSLCFISTRWAAVVVLLSEFVHVSVRWVYLLSGAVLRDSMHRGLRWRCKLISLATKSNSG